MDTITLTAFVLQAATSDPPPGSETPTQVTMSPAMAGARKSFLSWSLPNFARAGVDMSA